MPPTDPSSDSPPGLPPPALIDPLRRLLRPLVRVLLRRGVTFPMLATMLRGLFVEVAASELAAIGSVSDSRVSLLTGVHRKEIRRLRESATAPAAPPESLAVTSQVIARWLGAPGYADPFGVPLPLPRTAIGEAPSFESLVASVTTDIRPRAVLDEMVRQEMVALDDADQVRLQVAAYLPRQDAGEALFYFGRNLHDHIAAAGANILAFGAPPFVDRSVHYDRLRPETAARLEQEAREAAQRLLLEFNRRALELADADDAAGEPLIAARRINLGVYLFLEDEVDEGGTAP
jgi:Family of unknown function (DUF6502)